MARWRLPWGVMGLAMMGTAGVGSGATIPPVDAPHPRVLLVLQSGIDPEELLGPDGPLRAMPEAAVALMNTAVAGPQRVSSAFLTIGAGARMEAKVGPEGPPGFYLPDEQ